MCTKALFLVTLCTLWATPALAELASICDQVPGNSVVNCGFEMGDFTRWALSGNTSNPGGFYYGVDAIDAFSGNFGAYLGPLGAPLDLSQSLATQTGAEYSISFWLEQDTLPTPGYVHDFSASFGGLLLLSLVNPGTTGWINYSFVETATSSITPLQFSVRNDDTYWSFDDVSVSQVPEPSATFLTGIVLCSLLALRRRVPRR